MFPLWHCRRGRDARPGVTSEGQFLEGQRRGEKLGEGLWGCPNLHSSQRLGFPCATRQCSTRYINHALKKSPAPNCVVQLPSKAASQPPATMSSLTYYAASPREALVAEYVGKSIRDVPTPAAIINVAAVRRNCSRMLEACKSLNLGWRAHVKTHKVRWMYTSAFRRDVLTIFCKDGRNHPAASR